MDDSVIYEDPEPIHGWFSLTYANTLVLDGARTQHLEPGWHYEMTRMRCQLDRAFAHVPRAYEYLAVAGTEATYDDLTAEEMVRMGVSTTEPEVEHENCDHGPEPQNLEPGETVHEYHERYRQWMNEVDTAGTCGEIYFYDDRGDQFTGDDRCVVPTETIEQARAASRIVVHRSLLQSMPAAWQQQFVDLLRQADEVDCDAPDTYEIKAFDEQGREIDDPVPHYRRGRTHIEPRLEAHA